MAFSNSFLRPLEIIPQLHIWDDLGKFSFYIENGIFCTQRGDSNENAHHTFTLKKIKKSLPGAVINPH